MARIAYILLSHKDPDGVIAQAERLTAAGDLVAIHHDTAAPRADFARIRDALAGNPSVILAPRRRCGWGEWSLVDATLRTLRAARAAFAQATHFYMLSGDCMPIRTAEQARALLDAEDADFIEAHDFHRSNWIRTGMREERLIYRHFFNERRHKRLFYAAMDLQRRLGLKRRLPDDLGIRIGSQWWCLRRSTIDLVLQFCTDRPDVIRFFRRCWIPDESFFQTIVWHLVPAERIRCRPPTFLMFSDYGMPVTFHDDHLDLMLQQDGLFARKISPEARLLRERLGKLYGATGYGPPRVSDGRALHRYLTGRGRVGRRFAPNAWDAAASPGGDRRLLILACRNWAVGARLADRLCRASGVPGLGYLFNDPEAWCPDLGGLQTTLQKRGRHRRAVLGLLFDLWKTDRMLICIDPDSTDFWADFRADRYNTRILDVFCDFSEDGLADLARRIGLAGAMTTLAARDRLLPDLRRSLIEDCDWLRLAGLGPVYPIRQRAGADENAVSLAAFLGIPVASALQIAAPGTLFAD